MKKGIGKIFLCLLLVIVFGIGIKNVKANTINSISMDIYVDNYGDAYVTEVWNCKLSSGTELYHPYFNLGKSKISNLTVSESSRTYTTLSSWEVDASFNNKAYKCGINKVSNGVELCWGASNYGSHVYTVKYKIEKFVSELTDSQMIYWTLMPKGFSDSVKDAKIKIHTDFNIADTIDVWGYGKYGGTAYVYNGNIQFNSMSTLTSSEYMTILVKFPQGTFNASNKIHKNFNYYLKMAEEGSTKYVGEKSTDDYSIMSPKLMLITFAQWGMGIGAIILFVKVILSTSNSNTKQLVITSGEKRSVKKVGYLGYYSEIPCEDIFRAYYISTKYEINKNKTDFLGALLLKWIKENKIRMEKRATKSRFKPEETVFVLNKEPEFSNDIEKKLYNMVYKSSKDGILEGDEFKNWCKTNNLSILNWFDDVINKIEEKILDSKEVEKKINMFGKEVKNKYVTTLSIQEEAMKIAGLKKYLKDYSLIKEKEPLQVHLFEEYMIYAQMLGIAKKVAKMFKEVYPEIIEESCFVDYESIIYVDRYTDSGIEKARVEKARAEAIERASNYSSGGGGFSSGGGGGGSFGGGGSGGGIR